MTPPIMQSEVASRPVFRRVLYSQAWEDPRCDLEAWQLRPDEDVLAVGASGDNALAFVAGGAARVTAVDFNPTQHHLLELKVAALEALDPDEVHAFLGVRPSTRRGAYYRHVRAGLSAEARAFWEAQPRLIEEGVLHVGRFERYLALFRRTLLPLIHPRRVRERLFELGSLEEQRAFYREVWDTRRWRTLFRAFFGRRVMGRLGRDPAFFKYVEEGRVGDALRRRFEHAICELPVADNWFLEYMVHGAYREPWRRLPMYLRPEHHATLRARARGALRLLTGSFEELLPREPAGRYACFYLSDVFEWMSEAAFADLLRAVCRVARPGARITYRNLLVRREHPPALDGLLEHDAARSRALQGRDRSFVWSNFVLERVLPSGAGEVTS